jgi:hypothetical protein
MASNDTPYHGPTAEDRAWLNEQFDALDPPQATQRTSRPRRQDRIKNLAQAVREQLRKDRVARARSGTTPRNRYFPNARLELERARRFAAERDHPEAAPRGASPLRAV